MVTSAYVYHKVEQRVAVNRLRLGTIITGIQGVTRLNAGKEPKIDEERLNHYSQTNADVTTDAALNGDAGVELRVAALGGIGLEGQVNGARGNFERHNFRAIDTTDFEPTQKDYNDAGQAEEVQTFLKKSNYRPVFYITGIKVGRVQTEEGSEPTFEATRMTSMGGTLGLGVNIPTIASIGPRITGSRSLTITQQYREHNDYIFAIRVQKLRYKKRMGLFGPREWVNKPYNDGAELVGVDSKGQEEEEPEIAFDEIEELDLDENDLKGYKQIAETDNRGKQITYVVPNGW
ncbi:uncharacterized protein Triagg1_2212 [Trichoderma aggressivum f. europaeum]|uniref:Uncharacterized protein n=1 Tax=Trichoderma aggressivum f. europaeum TaxID=173218 RepID=A0AAE1ILB5_9HYPO|nr:hypothetical protein Triagg1_2212 [Trichoderma aggressivum f. europaeum]